jgi:hypothetical protein
MALSMLGLLAELSISTLIFKVWGAIMSVAMLSVAFYNCYPDCHNCYAGRCIL